MKIWSLKALSLALAMVGGLVAIPGLASAQYVGYYPPYPLDAPYNYCNYYPNNSYNYYYNENCYYPYAYLNFYTPSIYFFRLLLLM